MSQTWNIADNQYLVDLPLFQGPMDLLLYLIKKDEIDIYDIPIAGITRQYLEYIDLLKDLDIEVAGEYVLMAASLIRLKVRLLLPRDDEEKAEDDPRHELMQALIEYRKFKEAGEMLRDTAIIEEAKVVPPSPLKDKQLITDLTPGPALFDLLTAFKEMVAERQEEIKHEVDREEISVEERIAYVLAFLNNKEFATFRDLFADMPRKIVAIVTFIALLEMTRLRRIKIMQSSLFEELRVYRGENFDSTAAEIEETENALISETVGQ